jgi:hypothetical protein
MLSRAYTSILTARLAIAFCVSLTIAAMGCSGPSDGDGDAGDAGADTNSATPLVSPHSWSAIQASEDPVADAPDTTMCDVANGTKTEELTGETAFGVDTTTCAYVAVRQSTLSPVSEGDTVFVRAWHFKLTAPEDTEAHLAVALDGETIWEERIPIPTERGKLMTAEWTATRDIPVGSDVVFHAHNHGNNEYYLIEVSRK